MKNVQGTADEFYKSGQLLPENFLKSARGAGYDDVQVHVREQEGYDHSYYFVSTHREFFRLRRLLSSPPGQVSTFAEDHIRCKWI